MFRLAAQSIFLSAALVLFSAPSAQADYNEGRAAWDAGRYADVVTEWRAAADSGKKWAMLALGRAFMQQSRRLRSLPRP